MCLANKRRTFFLSVILLVGLNGMCFAKSKFYMPAWVKKFFLEYNMLYNYEKLSSEDDFFIRTNNMLFEFGLGYDFGRVLPRFFVDAGLPLDGKIRFTESDEDVTKVMDTKNFKIGLEVGFKPVKTAKVDMLIPLGFLFCTTTYTQKNPVYIQDTSYDRTWDYKYTTLYSGIDVAFALNKHFKLGLLGRIGLPIEKEFEYSESLNGNYVWSGTGSGTRSVKKGVDVLTFSAGIGIRANL